MPILYSAVANEGTIVGSVCSCKGNFTEIVNELLQKILLRDHKKTYFHGKYLFHYIVESKTVYLCITDKTCQRSRAFLFLNQIRRKCQEISSDEFRSFLAETMYRYSEDYSDITIRKGELDELNNISVESSENILGEKILNVLYNPDETLQHPASFQINTIHQVTELSEKQGSHNFAFVIICTLGILLAMYCNVFTVSAPVCVILFISFLIRIKLNKN